MALLEIREVFRRFGTLLRLIALSLRLVPDMLKGSQ